MTVNAGDRWVSSDSKSFRVLSVLEKDNEVWIHYIDDHGREYSCWEESFIHRFRKDLTSERQS